MNEYNLRYIMEIAKEGNITKAAQNLNISQPSLSGLLIDIERRLGAKLFDRSFSPIKLTYAGEKFIVAAEKILGTLHELQHQIDDMNNSLIGRLHIGCGSQQSTFLIPAIIPIMMDKYPGIHFKMYEDTWDVLERQLLNGTLDAILHGRKISHPNIDSIVLSDDEMLLFTPISIKPAKITKRSDRIFPCIDLRAQGSIPFVLMTRKHKLRDFQDHILKESGYEPEILLETDNWLTCLNVAASGIAATILPYVNTNLVLPQVGTFSFEKEYKRQTTFCFRKNVYFPKILQAFIEVACSAFNQC